MLKITDLYLRSTFVTFFRKQKGSLGYNVPAILVWKEAGEQRSDTEDASVGLPMSSRPCCLW